MRWLTYVLKVSWMCVDSFFEYRVVIEQSFCRSIISEYDDINEVYMDEKFLLPTRKTRRMFRFPTSL